MGAVATTVLAHLSVVVATTALLPTSTLAVPVVPNFTQGSMSSHTETTQTVTETINSMDYSTGYQYSATGSGVTASGNLSPGTGATNITIDGVTSSWTGVTSKPQFTQTTPGVSVSVHRNLLWPGSSKSYNYSKGHGGYQRHRDYKYLLAISIIICISFLC